MSEPKNRYLDAISKFYGNRKAERSQVPLINHIKEGLRILTMVGASQNAMDAFCIHPMFQSDADLLRNLRCAADFDAVVMMLVMEYRSRANEHLSDKVDWFMNKAGLYWKNGEPSSGPLLDVRHMLIADKVQNYADFLVHHDGKHARSMELNFYFKGWLKALNVDQAAYDYLSQGMRA